MESREKGFGKFFESMPDADSDWMGITDNDMLKLYEYQEKAEKYDSLMNANHEIVQNNISHTQIHQENKALKEKIKGLKN